MKNKVEIIKIGLDIIIILIGAFIILSKSYMNEKGKNLATKQDIKEITSKIESVKRVYQKKSQIDNLEIELNQDLYKMLSELRNNFEDFNQKTANNSAVQEDADKLDKTFGDLKRLIVSHKDTYYKQYKDRFKSLEETIHSFYVGIKVQDNKKFIEKGEEILNILDLIRVDIYEYLKSE